MSGQERLGRIIQPALSTFPARQLEGEDFLLLLLIF